MNKLGTKRKRDEKPPLPQLGPCSTPSAGLPKQGDGCCYVRDWLHSSGLKQIRGGWLCLGPGLVTWRPPVHTGPREYILKRHPRARHTRPPARPLGPHPHRNRLLRNKPQGQKLAHPRGNSFKHFGSPYPTKMGPPRPMSRAAQRFFPPAHSRPTARNRPPQARRLAATWPSFVLKYPRRRLLPQPRAQPSFRRALLDSGAPYWENASGRFSWAI